MSSDKILGIDSYREPRMSRKPGKLHRVRITVPDARAILGRIEIDGQEVRGVTGFSVGADVNGSAELRLNMLADLDLDGEFPVHADWRERRRWLPSRWAAFAYGLAIGGWAVFFLFVLIVTESSR